ncbi:MAG: Hsp20/alpha crystallin family protein [Acidobacteria bacterium]|nr:MAG: Hsp20/alpha crystallin family protein [Acidobacteriota bacterium]
MQREMDNLLRRTRPALTGRTETEMTPAQREKYGNLPFWSGYPAVDAWIEDHNLHVNAELPGMKPDDIEVLVENNQLVIRGRRTMERTEKDRNYLLREVGEGWFERRFTLPEGIDADKINASYENGVLHLTLPASEQLAPRKVPIQIGSGEKKAEAAHA